MNSLTKTIPIAIEDEMKESYLDYAMSVIVSRALPDVRDGLKPVHRRILYAMHKLGLTPDKPHRKSATIVGDVIGKYHPHGDVAVYDALVRMAQNFNLRYILVDGHGNFGSVDGDPPAAYRYTEARLNKIALELLEDLEKETVDFRPNFDNSHEEPVILPGKIPNLLINGSTGIAVGMATNIPPHNLGEIIDGLTALIKNPALENEELMKIILAPDFPTGGYILGLDGARQAYTTGRGSITLRAKISFEEIRHKRQAIIITEIPYQVNKTRLIEQIAEGVRIKKIIGISDIRDESDREGMRLVLELQSHTNTQIVLNQLYKHSNLQCNFGIIILALVDGAPKILTLKECLHLFLKHRKEIVIRRGNYELKKAKERAHILDGLKIALENLDAVIKIIRSSQKVEDAKASLISKFKFSDIQAQAILEMRLQRLTALEQQKIINEQKSLLKIISHLEELLKSEVKIFELIKNELKEVKEKFLDKRRTQILQEEGTIFSVEDLIHEEEAVITYTNSGYIKRQPITSYHSQKRGGRGILGLTMKEEDFLEHIFTTTTHHYLLFFTNCAKVYRLKVYEIPEAGRQAKGTALINLLNLAEGEKVSAIFPIKEFKADEFLLVATKKGIVNKTSLAYFVNIRKGGLQALVLDEGDELIDVRLTTGNLDIMLVTKLGQAIRFLERQIRPTGRKTRGVRGIRLRPKDEVVSMMRIVGERDLLVVTSLGYGKRTSISSFKPQRRGGKGVKLISITIKKGEVVSAKAVEADDEVMLITKKEGTIIRLKVSGISLQGRTAQGITLIKVIPGDELTSMALVSKKDFEEE